MYAIIQRLGKCVSAIEEIVREEAAKGLDKPASVQIFMPDSDGFYINNPLLRFSYDALIKWETEASLWLYDLINEDTGSLEGRAICAIDVGNPVVEDLNDEVKRWLEDRDFTYVEFSGLEVAEHTDMVIRGTACTYTWSGDKLSRYLYEEIILLFPANAV